MAKRKSDGTPVVFRVLKSGQVVALLPSHKEPLGKCVTVREVVIKNVVTGTDNYKSIIEHSRPARPSEILDLLSHFLRQSMVMSVRKKWTKKDEQDS